MARKSITRRWLVNGLGVIAVLLLLFEVILSERHPDSGRQRRAFFWHSGNLLFPE